jgi:hypothetical protein
MRGVLSIFICGNLFISALGSAALKSSHFSFLFFHLSFSQYVTSPGRTCLIFLLQQYLLVTETSYCIIFMKVLIIWNHLNLLICCSLSLIPLLTCKLCKKQDLIFLIYLLPIWEHRAHRYRHSVIIVAWINEHILLGVFTLDPCYCLSLK